MAAEAMFVVAGPPKLHLEEHPNHPIPRAGWRGHDPTNTKLAGSEHIRSLCHANKEGSPPSGSWEGSVNAGECAQQDERRQTNCATPQSVLWF
jgi:hypothetical protein